MVWASSTTSLPAPSPDAQALSDQLSAVIAGEIIAAGGCISFARYMELALYAPGLGYYSAGSTKFGEAGDFTTSPELGPLFASCVAQAVALLSEARQVAPTATAASTAESRFMRYAASPTGRA